MSLVIVEARHMNINFSVTRFVSGSKQAAMVFEWN